MNFYNVSRKTKLIKMNESTFYRSCIIEENQVQEEKEYYSDQSPEQIIDYNCKRFGSTLKGRREVVRDILNSSNKIPIPVIPQQGVYMIPTASTKSKSCVWLSYQHIKDYVEEEEDKTNVNFYDGTSTIIETSETIFDRQIKRTSKVIVHFNRNNLFGKGPKLW